MLAAAFPDVGIGLLGVSLAFGLTVLTMAYAVGHISGGHFNPAVTVGLFTARRIPLSDVLPYIVAQVIGAIVIDWNYLAREAGDVFAHPPRRIIKRGAAYFQ